MSYAFTVDGSELDNVWSSLVLIQKGSGLQDILEALYRYMHTGDYMQNFADSAIPLFHSTIPVQ